MYFITTIDHKNDDNRCVGYYDTFEKAEKALEGNIFDLWETCYDYAVIENIPEGLYQYDFHPVWYKYCKGADRYERIEKPPFIEPYDVGFAIG